jgi:hypothetical protein
MEWSGDEMEGKGGQQKEKGKAAKQPATEREDYENNTQFRGHTHNARCIVTATFAFQSDDVLASPPRR